MPRWKKMRWQDDFKVKMDAQKGVAYIVYLILMPFI